MTTPAEVAKALRQDAKKNTGKEVSFRIFSGWKFGLSYGRLPLPPRDVVDRLKGPVAARIGEPDLARANYEQIAAAKEAHGDYRGWILSASLHPRGRSSVEADWHLLGQMVGAVGVPEGSCRTPPETTHPNDVHYWLWIEPEASS